MLLYSSETWVLPDAQLDILEGFHVECAWRLMGMQPCKRGDKWVYPKFASLLRVAGLQLLCYYIQKRRPTVAKTIAMRSVFEECKGRRGYAEPQFTILGGSRY